MSREAFEKSLKENKYDETAHKAYADWLYENGFDSEAEFHANWTPHWQQSWDWLEALSLKGGSTCTNYDEICKDHREKYKKWIEAGKPGGYEGLHSTLKEGAYVPITVELLIQAGYDYINNGEVFYQQGSEELRDLFYADKDLIKQFWHHWKVVTGENLPDESISDGYGGVEVPFGCSC